MQYNFPQTRFARNNTIGAQIGHVVEEAEEVIQTLIDGEDNNRVDEELADLTHSLETLWRIMARERGPEYVKQLFERVTVKNAARNYYADKNQETTPCP